MAAAALPRQRRRLADLVYQMSWPKPFSSLEHQRQKGVRWSPSWLGLSLELGFGSLLLLVQLLSV